MAKYKYGLFGAFLALLLLVSSQPVLAQGAPLPGTPSCDTNYWESLKHRAWAEAQREITVNQNLIFKPDSVLEYSCFQDWVSDASMAASAGNIFSEVSPLNSSLRGVVGSAVSTYLNTSFGHDFLGGRFGGIAEQPTAPAGFCGTMDRVWEKAKCMNFIEPAFLDSDGFFSLVEHALNPDLRVFPQGRACDGPDPAVRLQRLGIAYNVPDAQVPSTATKIDRPGLILHREPYTIALREIIIPKLDPAACTAFIPTGVQVFSGPGDTSGYDDAICTNPGCVYIEGAGCQQAGSPAGIQGNGGGGGVLNFIPGLNGG